jgi:transcriptional regulator NrdR family protein|tara:strand:- start:72 stop:353 length:282 start_codon:yes stop_codon:yes gene_type:complete
MDCPKCGKSSFNYEKARKVIETRSDQKGGIRRRRICPACEYRFTTYEIHQHNLITDPECRKEMILDYKEELSKTINKSRETILFALDQIFLDL